MEDQHLGPAPKADDVVYNLHPEWRRYYAEVILTADKYPPSAQVPTMAEAVKLTTKHKALLPDLSRVKGNWRFLLAKDIRQIQQQRRDTKKRRHRK